MKNFYFEREDKTKCNGCGTCTLICPQKCIHMEEDEEGFLYPKIDLDKCINCGKCKNICSNNEKNGKIGKAYLAINKDDEERKRSSSGGMFSLLMKFVIEKKGVVFGVQYDKELNVIHSSARTIEECYKFRESKYVRSLLGDSFLDVKKLLEQNKYVLFTGTPCQIAGLNTFLGKEYEKLITCEIICHANPSPKVFSKYKSELENIKGKKIVNIHFRSKENGWRNSTPIIEYQDGEKEEDTLFYIAFIQELINRPSCHECVFVGIKRQADFTIGDFWGIEKIKPELDDDRGISLLLVNSEKARNIFQELDLYSEEVNLDLAFSYNHNTNIKPNKNRKQFFRDLNKNKSVINLMRKYTKVPIIKRIIRHIKNS